VEYLHNAVGQADREGAGGEKKPVNPTFISKTDDELQEYLCQHRIEWKRLQESDCMDAETAWRRIYGHAFQKRPRVLRGVKAEHEYINQSCNEYLIVPFSANVPNLPISVHGRALAGYACRGPLVGLGQFCDAEFFIAPHDFSWSMIHTHEDHALGGPFFIRAADETSF
jgi:hypothetical protein